MLPSHPKNRHNLRLLAGTKHHPARLVAVPRYFFDIHNDIETRDEDGIELPDLAAARDQALEGARSMICESIQRHGAVNLGHRIDIRDEAGAVVLSTTFREAFTITG